MGKKAFEEKLREIEMSPYDHRHHHEPFFAHFSALVHPAPAV